MAGEAKLGIKCKLYLNLPAVYGAPVWSEANKVSDLTQNAAWDEGNSSTRASRVKKSRKTMLGLDWKGKIRVSDDDPIYLAIWAAAHDDSVLDALILNGPMTENGVRGYRCDVQVLEQTEDQSMGNVLFMDFTLKPADSANEPKKAVVTAGAPVYSEAAPTV